MAAVLVLESMIPPARLKPWWRLWAFPVPLPSQTGLFTTLFSKLPGNLSAQALSA